MSGGHGELPDGWVEATIKKLCRLNPKHDRYLPDKTEISIVPMAAVSDFHGTTTDQNVSPPEPHCTGGLTPHRSPFMTHCGPVRIIHTLNRK